MKKEVEVTFETITPLWTGDAWQDNREIRPSSLVGSLRFWFEVIMYFAGVLEIQRKNGKVINFKEGRFEKEMDRGKFQDFISQNGNVFETRIQALMKQKIPISSIVFGTTNWKSLIEIKSIQFDENNFKDEPLGKIIHNKNWYFGSPFYQGEFEVIFKVEKHILNSIFHPLLTFMEKYGFWGGKWNIGYGRLKVKSEYNEVEEFDLRAFDFNTENRKIRIDKIVEFINNFDELTNYNDKKIKILGVHASDDDFKELVKELIKIKSQKRADFRNDTELRHKIFGTTKSPPKKDFLPQGSKILPYINEIERDKFPYDCGFLSITGLLNLEGEINEKL